MRFSACKSLIVSATLAGLLLFTACPKNGQSKGDITIPQSDATPPTISLQVAVVGSSSTTAVSTGGNDATLSLNSKTITLNIAATAKDQESGIQALEIDIGNSLTVTCQANGGPCSQSGPGSVSAVWSATNPKLSPGDLAVSSSIMLETLDPVAKGLLHPAAMPPSGGSFSESFTVSAKAINQLGGSASTPDVTVSSKLP